MTSDAVTSSPVIVTPAPETTISVMRLRSRSRPGSARCSHAIRTAPITTDSTAAAPMYHHSDDCKNATVPEVPTGPSGIAAETIELAAAISTTAPSTRPSRPTLAAPSPRRIRTATRPPSANSDSTATTRPIQVTYPRTVVRLPAFAAADPAVTDDVPPVEARFGVPMFTHTVPSEATVRPKASITA